MRDNTFTALVWLALMVPLVLAILALDIYLIVILASNL